MFSHLQNKVFKLQWEIIESQVCKDTQPTVQLNLDSNLVQTLPHPIPITLTVPSHSNTPESRIESQLPAVSTSSGMILIFTQPPSLLNEATHNSRPLSDSYFPSHNQQPPNPRAIMPPAAAPPPSSVVTWSKNNIFTPKKKFSFLAHLYPTPNTFK